MVKLGSAAARLPDGQGQAGFGLGQCPFGPFLGRSQRQDGFPKNLVTFAPGHF